MIGFNKFHDKKAVSVMSLVLVVLCIVLIVSFLTVAYFMVGGAFISIDHYIIHFVSTFEHATITNIMKFISLLGAKELVIILSLLFMALFYMKYKNRNDVLVFLFASAGSAFLNVILKNSFKRDRPTIIQIIEETGYSFPSGHSMASFTFYGIIAFLCFVHLKTPLAKGMVIIISTVFIFSVGLSRIYLGVHYPSDVFGGYLMSACWLTVSIALYQYLERKKKSL